LRAELQPSLDDLASNQGTRVTLPGHLAARARWIRCRPARFKGLKVWGHPLRADCPTWKCCGGSRRDVEAEQDLRDALAIRANRLGERHPDTIATLLMLAAFARRQGNLELDAQLIAQARVLNPRQVAEALAARDDRVAQPDVSAATDIPSARQQLAQALQEHGAAHPEVASRMIRLADLLTAAEQFDEAERLYGDALAIWSREIDSEHPRAREVFAKLEQLYERLGQPERMIPLLSERLERARRSGDNARVLSSAAWDVVKRPEPPPDLGRRALEVARRACELRPENGAFLNTLGVAQYRAGLFEEARATLVHADRLNDGHPADIAFLAMTLARLGRVEEAQREFERLRALMR
jgi:tetratricopeptide (TPR) repeat protein